MRAAALSLLLVLLCACSGSEDGSTAPGGDPAPVTPAATASTAGTVDEPLPCVAGVEPFTGPAADRFGAEEVMAAYCWLVDLAREQERTSLAQPAGAQRPADLASVAESLTVDAAREWGRAVGARAAGDRAAGERVDGLLLHDVRRAPAGYAFADDPPHLYGTRYLPATAEPVRGGEALEITFALETGVVLEERGDDSGRHSLLPVTRTGSYVLVPDGDGWAIDDWEATFEHGTVALVSG